MHSEHVGEIAVEMARAHPHNDVLQDGVVELLDALERARLSALAELGQPPPSWTAAAHAHWLALAAHLRSSFAGFAPDRTALHRMLGLLRESYSRLSSVYRHYATASVSAAAGGARDAQAMGAALLCVREWLVLCKLCKVATRAYDQGELTRVFLQTSLGPPKPELAEHSLDFAEFVHALVIVAFERLNPFASEWLLGRSADVPLVPIDEAVSHLLHDHIFLLSDVPAAEAVLRLIRTEQVHAPRSVPSLTRLPCPLALALRSAHARVANCCPEPLPQTPFPLCSPRPSPSALAPRSR
jgi:hypothetical protein